MPLVCEYILSLTNFIIKKSENFLTNNSVRGINTRNKNDIHTSSTSLVCYKKGVHYMDIRTCILKIFIKTKDS